VEVWSSRSTSATGAAASVIVSASIIAAASASASSPSIPTISAISSAAGSVCTVVMTSLLVPVPVLAGVLAGAPRLVRVVAGRAAVVRSAAFRAGAVRTVLGMRHLLPYARVTADASLGGPPRPAPPSRGRHRLEIGWYCEARALTRTLGAGLCSRGGQSCSPRGGFAMARRIFPGARAPGPPRTTVNVGGPDPRVRRFRIPAYDGCWWRPGPPRTTVPDPRVRRLLVAARIPAYDGSGSPRTTVPDPRVRRLLLAARTPAYDGCRSRSLSLACLSLLLLQQRLRWRDTFRARAGRRNRACRREARASPGR
jgi:hypothetical protein